MRKPADLHAWTVNFKLENQTRHHLYYETLTLTLNPYVQRELTCWELIIWIFL